MPSGDLLFSESVSCCEEHATRREDYDVENGAKRSVTLRCAWADRDALVNDILGNLRLFPGTSGSGAPVALRASVVPAPDSATTEPGGQVLAYQDALVTIQYDRLNITGRELGEDTILVSESLEPSIQYSKLDHKMFRWGGVREFPLRENEAPGRPLYSMSLTRTHYKVPAPLPTELLTCIGQCNSSSYYSALLGLTFPEETLLFQPAGLTRNVTSEGVEAFNVKMRFMFKPEGWNRFWCALTNQYEQIFYVNPLLGTDPVKQFPPGDFSNLLF